ncbi:MAG: AAA family ATPase [Candidatus Helarchaeota archaeon]
MKIQRLSIRNFKCFRRVDLPARPNDEIPEGLIIIQGNTKERSNSFGKTSLVEAILVAFFGHVVSELSISDMITFGEKTAEIKLSFSLDSKEYLIIRKLTRGRSQSVKYFQKVGTEYKEDPSIDIEKLLQITWEQAKGTVFVKQGEIESLVQAKPAGLRDLIIKLFRLDITESAQDYLHQIKTDGEIELKKIRKKFRAPVDIKNEITEEKDELEKEKHKLNNVNDELKDLEQEIVKYPEINLIDELNKSNELLTNHEGKISAYNEDINEIINKYKVKETEIEALINKLNLKNVEIEKKIEKINKAKEELNKKETEIKTKINLTEKSINKIEKSIKFQLGKEIAKCPTCQRDISAKEKNEIIQHFQEEIDKLKLEIPKIDKKQFIIKPYQNEITENELIISKLKNTQKKIQNRKSLDDKIKKIRTEIGEKLIRFNVKTFNELLSKFGMENLMNLKSKIVSLQEQIKSRKNSASELEARIVKIEQKIKDLDLKLKEMKALKAKMDDIERKSLHADYCKKLVKSFVTEYMVEKRLIKNINSVTSNLIEYFTGRQYDSISLTAGGSQGTSLFISVHDTYNDILKEKKFLSGGDKAAIGFALRFGISELMRKIRPTKDSPKQNPRIDFLILDEPFGTLDTSRREEILKTLQSQKKFNQVFLITHTAIPDDINTHFIKISKDVNTGLSSSELIINENLI